MPDSSGYLIIRAFAANQAIPVENADVEIFTSGASPLRMASSKTDSSGQSDRFILPAPPLQYSDSPDDPSAFQTYEVRVDHPDYDKVQIEGVSIFPGITSVLPVRMSPLLPGSTQETKTVNITTGINGAGGEHA